MSALTWGAIVCRCVATPVLPSSAAVAASGLRVLARGGSHRLLRGPLGSSAPRAAPEARAAPQAPHAVHRPTVNYACHLRQSKLAKGGQCLLQGVRLEQPWVAPRLLHHHQPTMGPPPCLLSPLQRLASSRARAARSMDTDVAHVRRALPRLQSLQLAYNRLEGSLPCALAGAPLVSLGAASNRLSGSLPACLLRAPMAQLALAGNGLSGWLPAPPPGCALQALSLHGQVTPVLRGPPARTAGVKVGLGRG